jgi:hypothetical protein
MAVKYIDPAKEGIHPLRLTLSQEEMGEILQGIIENKDWMSLDEIEAAQDYLFDHIAADRQTHLGETALQ